MLDNFLDLLFGEDSGWVHSPVKTSSGFDNEHFFFWPHHKAKLVEHIHKSADRGDVYISPALFKGRKADLDGVKSSRTLWVEFDGNYTANFKGLPEPSLIVQSSLGNRVHCYWQLESSIPVGEIQDLNRRLAYYLDSDSSGWDATQLLRPPETKNHKYDPPLPVHVKVLEADHKSAKSSFESLPEVQAYQINLQDVQLLDHQTVLGEVKLSPELYHQVTTEVVVHPHRSVFMAKIAYSLAESGCSMEQIVSLLYFVDDRIEKFKHRTDRLQRLVNLAAVALNKVNLNGGKTSVKTAVFLSPLDIINNEEQLDFVIGDGWLHTRGFMIVSGAPGIGKTQLGLNMMHSLVEGIPFLGKNITDPVGDVMFLSLEMQPIELQYIFKHQYQSFEEQGATARWVEHFSTYAPLEGFDMEIFEACVKQLQPKVILIDSLSELFHDDMKEGPARQVIRFMDYIRHTYEVAIVMIHHNRKASDTNKKPNKLSDLYGSFIFGKAVDTVITLWEEKGALEIIDLKVRYGQRSRRDIVRGEHLTFTLKEKDASKESGATDSLESTFILG